MTSNKKSPRDAPRITNDSDVRAVTDAKTIPPPFDLQKYAREQSGRPVPPSFAPSGPPPASDARPRASVKSPDAIRSELCERFFVGDYVTVLKLAEGLLEQDAFDQVARDYVDDCHRVLEREYTRRLGSLRVVPVLLVPIEKIKTVGLDPQTSFFLSQVDGTTALETLLDIVPIPRWEALRLVHRLVREGAILLGG